MNDLAERLAWRLRQWFSDPVRTAVRLRRLIFRAEMLDGVILFLLLVWACHVR